MRLNSIIENKDLYICEGVNMGKKALNKMMTESNIIVGFEAEFETSKVFDKTWWQEEDYDPQTVDYDEIQGHHAWDSDRFQDEYMEWYDAKRESYEEQHHEHFSEMTYDDIVYDHGEEIRNDIQEKYIQNHENDDQFEDHDNDDDKHQAILDHWQEEIDTEYSDAIRSHDDWDEVYSNKVDTDFGEDERVSNDDYFDDDRWSIYEYMGIDSEYGDDAEINEAELENYAEQLAETCGFEFEEICDGYDCASKHKDGWFMETDGEGPELISPALPIGETMGYMEKIFDYLAADETVETNENTGMHVSVNIDGKEGKDYDILKIALFLGEQYVGKLFGRDDKSVRGKNWAEEHLPFLMQAMKKMAKNDFEFSTKDLFAIMDKNYDQFLSGFSLAAENQKRIVAELEHFGMYVFDEIFKESRYRVFNLDHLEEKGYIEFRKMGGIDYHKKYETVKDTVLRYAYVLKLATEPELERKEYQKKLYKLLSQMSAITDQSKKVDRKFDIQEKMFDAKWIDVDHDLRVGSAKISHNQANEYTGVKGKLRSWLTSSTKLKKQQVHELNMYAVLYMAGIWNHSTAEILRVDPRKYVEMFRLIFRTMKMDKIKWDDGFSGLLFNSNLNTPIKTEGQVAMNMEEFRDQSWNAIKKLV